MIQAQYPLLYIRDPALASRCIPCEAANGIDWHSIGTPEVESSRLWLRDPSVRIILAPDPVTLLIPPLAEGADKLREYTWPFSQALNHYES